MNTKHEEAAVKQGLTRKNGAIIENRLDWENAVYDELCEQGEMDRSDAQGIVEALEMQGDNILDLAWNNNVSAIKAATLILIK